MEKKIVSAHNHNRDGPIVRKRVGVGKDSRLSGRAGEVGLSLPRGGDGRVGGMGTIRGFWWTGVALQSYS